MYVFSFHFQMMYILFKWNPFKRFKFKQYKNVNAILIENINFNVNKTDISLASNWHELIEKQVGLLRL